MMTRNTQTIRLTPEQVQDLMNTPVEIAPAIPGNVHVALFALARRGDGDLAAGSVPLNIGTDVDHSHLQFQNIMSGEGITAEIPTPFQGGGLEPANSTFHENLPLMVQAVADPSAASFELELTVEYVTFPVALRQPKRGYPSSNNDA